MNLFISSNYNVTDEKWSIAIKFGNTTRAIALERIARIKYFPDSDFFGKKTYYKVFVLGLKKLLRYVDIERVNKVYVLNFPFSLTEIFPEKEIQYHEQKNHHLLHAFSAFYSSGFESGVALVIDGAGYEQIYNKEVCYSIWRFDNNSFENIYIGEIKKTKSKFGIGYVYALHSLILNIGEGAIMGLSSYGDVSFYEEIDLFGKDFLLRDKYTKLFEAHKNNGGGLGDIREAIYQIYGIKENEEIDRNKLNHNNFKHVARRLQYCTERVVLDLAQKAKKLTGLDNLCIAGGVGLNILANTLVLEKKIFKNLFVQPASDDTGLSLGGIHYLQNLYGDSSNNELMSYGLGQQYDDNEIEMELRKYKNYLTYHKSSNIFSHAAALLKDSHVIGFFQGGSEFGPRSLGFRSILARTDSLSIRNTINEIKKREYWRPLAPVILEEDLNKYFHTEHPSPFMLFNAKIKVDKFSEMIGVSHTDGTARYQTLNSKNNPFLHELLKEFYKKSGTPALINTSFNTHNEPIIEIPKEAIEMFLSTKLDYLIMGNYIVSKEKIFDEFSFSKENIYGKLFNTDFRILQKMDTFVLQDITGYEGRFDKGKIEFKNDDSIFTICLIENNIIGNKKNILLNFETEISNSIRGEIIANLKNNKKNISKLLLAYYNDFIDEEDVIDIIISHNNFAL